MCRWNQLDLVIVLLSIMGITLEKIEEASLPINPTIIRIMRVLRIARGMTAPVRPSSHPNPNLTHSFLHTCTHTHTGLFHGAALLRCPVKQPHPRDSRFIIFAWQVSAGFGQGVSRPDGTEKHSQLTNTAQNDIQIKTKEGEGWGEIAEGGSEPRHIMTVNELSCER